MTTIVADRRTGVMVSDSKLTISISKRDDVQARTQKIRKVRDALVGACGESPWTEQILRWAGTKRKRPIKYAEGKVSAEGLILTPTEIIHIDECGEPIILDQEFFSIGSGSHAALGAMLAGADAMAAVEIACKVDPHSEGPIQILRLTIPERTDV
jgi:ATP-dependent protease HslVU (ClpYQ) peptidase subunit